MLLRIKTSGLIKRERSMEFNFDSINLDELASSESPVINRLPDDRQMRIKATTLSKWAISQVG